MKITERYKSAYYEKGMKIGVFMTLIICVIITSTIKVNAENTGGTPEIRETEKTKVRMASSLSMGSDVNNIVNKTVFEEYLSKYASDITVAETSSEKLTVTFNSTGNQYQVNVNTGTILETEEPGEIFTGVESYMPTGFSEVSPATTTSGYTIQDSNGNQYVWVEVPKTTVVYPTAGLNITEFTSEEYTKIENDLHTYTSEYRADVFSDTWSSENLTGLTETAYNTLKQKMLKSVYQNGGFYVGKYETGIENSYRYYSDNSSEEDRPITEIPVIKANAYPYNYVKRRQAQTLASGMESGEYTTSLLFGVQWDLILKYLENNGVSQSLLNEDSTSWANCRDSEYNITNINAKYGNFKGSVWYSCPYNKLSGAIILLTTGADEMFSKMGIYDLAGNVSEWVLENNLREMMNYVTSRGGYHEVSVASSGHGFTAGTANDYRFGFRIALY